MRMKNLLVTGAAAIALTAALAGCSAQAATPASSGPSSSSPSSSSSAAAPATMLTGSFAGLNGKKVAGMVAISGDKVSLSGFSSDQGPDLHLYLTNGTTEADVTAGTEFSTVAYNMAAQSFALPSGVDASRFTDVVVHCDKALAVFGAAPLAK